MRRRSYRKSTRGVALRMVAGLMGFLVFNKKPKNPYLLCSRNLFKEAAEKISLFYESVQIKRGAASLKRTDVRKFSIFENFLLMRYKQYSNNGLA